MATIHRIIDTADLAQLQESQSVAKNQVAEVTLRVKSPIAFDLSSSFESTGRFVLVDEYDISGGGIITELVHDEQEDFTRRHVSGNTPGSREMSVQKIEPSMGTGPLLCSSPDRPRQARPFWPVESRSCW